MATAEAAAPAEAGTQATVLILAGPPGSGKSTFSQRLIKGASVPWHHVNQDTIGGKGKAGSRQQCVASAGRALAKGVNCIIDRCHTSVEQRQDFIELAQSLGCRVHCVVLVPPLALCQERVMSRTDHPTLEPGPRAKGLVTMMHKQLFTSDGMPDAGAEGLDSVSFCPDSASFDAALSAWLSFPASGWEQGLQHLAQPPPPPPSPQPGKQKEKLSREEKASLGKQQNLMQAWLGGGKKAGAAGQQQQQQQPGAEGGYPQAGPTARAVAAATAGQGSGAQQGPGAEGGPGSSSGAGAGAGAGPGPAGAKRRWSKVEGAGSDPDAAPRPAAAAAGAGPLAALQRFARDPAKYAADMEDSWWDERVLRLRDKFSKSQHHALVVAREPGLSSVRDLRPHHLELLQHMRDTALAWSRAQQSAAPFRMGFHQVPSLPQLHLHVISQDFDSACLKNKKHWNSFTSPYFLPLDAAVQQLAERGCVAVDAAAMEALLHRDLVCHRVGCGCSFRTMPQLKGHIKTCRQPFPS